jgi:DNA-binding NtrC family response regulator
MPGVPASDRDLLQLIATAALANPFGNERDEVDEILAATAGQRLSREERIVRVVARAEAIFARLRARGVDPTSFNGDDRDLFDAAALFVVFHRYIERFDAFIRDQLVAGAHSLPLPFARELLADLVSVGFSGSEAPRFVAVLFQMRRAFYFLDTTLAGTSPSMRRLRARLWQNIFTADLLRYVRVMWQRMEDFSTLLLGETGSGKGAAAAAIGRSAFIPFDPRERRFAVSFTESFLPINLSQYPDALLESELFGHKRGAFTGALETHLGVFARGSPHGAIFLDEIGETSTPTQIKLLRVLQERTFSPVGMHETVRFEGRVIAATHRALGRRSRRRQAGFRDDFYYRLSSDVVELPSLRQRLAEDPGELDLLLSVIVRRIVGADQLPVVDEARTVIEKTLDRAYAWPGNVRELEQCVRRVLLRGSYEGEVTVARAGGKTSEARSRHGQLLDLTDGGTLDASALLARYCAALHLELGTYEQVARRTGLDRRTVKKYIERAAATERSAQ